MQQCNKCVNCKTAKSSRTFIGGKIPVTIEEIKRECRLNVSLKDKSCINFKEV